MPRQRWSITKFWRGPGKAHHRPLVAVEIGQPISLSRVVLVVGGQPKLKDATATRAAGFVQDLGPGVAAQELEPMG
jgi:hypothetical protein